MADEFAEHLLISSLAHMFKQQGWHQASQSGLSLFSELARHYIRNIGIISLRYSLHAGRFDTDLDDLGKALSELGISLSELQRFWSETEPLRGLPQVCNFPAPLSVQLNFPEVPNNEACYIPEYLPAQKEHLPPPLPEKTEKEETPIVDKTPTDHAPDPFDAAVAAPAPSAPNFPFVNKTDLPVPSISSWGFQRINIDTKKSSSPLDCSDISESKPSTPPDNFLLSENSDDFVFASKHYKSIEDKKNSKYDNIDESEVTKTVNSNANDTSCTPDTSINANDTTLIVKELVEDPKLGYTNHVEMNTSDDAVMDVSSVLPPKTSTPLVVSNQKSKLVENGLSPGPLLKDLHELPVKSTENSSFKSFPSTEMPITSTGNDKTIAACAPKTNNIPEQDMNNFINDFDSDGSGYEDMTSKENVERLIKPISPISKPQSPVISVPAKSPPNKRRKLDSPSLSPTIDRTLLKNRPDLIKDDVIKKAKPDCKLISNYQLLNKTSHSKPLKNHKKGKVSSMNEFSKPNSDIIGNNHNQSHKVPKKIKKKEIPQTIDLFNDGPNKLTVPKNEKSKTNPEIKNSTDSRKDAIFPVSKGSVQNCSQKVEPMKLSIPRKGTENEKEKVSNAKSSTAAKIDILKVSDVKVSDVKKETKKDDPSSRAHSKDVLDEKSVNPIRISLKNVKNSKYKSKSTIDTEDDLSSLSSDSLEEFRELLPKKVSKVKKSSEHKSKRTFKTKAELKNPWPSAISSPQQDPVEKNVQSSSPTKDVENKKKKPASVTTKIKIAKPALSVSPQPNVAPVKTSVKLKLPNPILADSQERNIPSVSPGVSQPSLSKNDTLERTLPQDSVVTAASLRIPKIKIKIGGNHVSHDGSSSPTLSFSSSMSTNAERPVTKAENQSIVPSSKSVPPLKLSAPPTKPLTKGQKSSKAQETNATPKLVLPVSKPLQTKENPTSSACTSSDTKSQKNFKTSLPTSIPALKIKIPEKDNAAVQEVLLETKSPKEKKEKKAKKVKVEKKATKSLEKTPAKATIKEKAKVIEPIVSLIPSLPDATVSTEAEGLESTLISETVVSETVAQSEDQVPIKVWYCPTCMLPDDGSPMVGCDTCDEWYHWPCVGLVQAPPENIDWYCPPCLKLKSKTPSKAGRKPGTKRKRKT